MPGRQSARGTESTSALHHTKGTVEPDREITQDIQQQSNKAARVSFEREQRAGKKSTVRVSDSYGRASQPTFCAREKTPTQAPKGRLPGKTGNLTPRRPPVSKTDQTRTIIALRPEAAGKNARLVILSVKM